MGFWPIYMGIEGGFVARGKVKIVRSMIGPAQLGELVALHGPGFFVLLGEQIGSVELSRSDSGSVEVDK